MLFQQIYDLTNQAVQYIDQDEIDKCAACIGKRQTLLEALKADLDTNTDQVKREEFIKLLQFIQSKDALAQSKLAPQKEKVLNKRKSQIKVNNALNAYSANKR